MEIERANAEHALEKLFLQVTSFHLEPQFSREGIESALVQLMALAADIVENINKAQGCVRVECGPGCSYCCYSQVQLTPAEALFVFSWIDMEFSHNQLGLLQKRIDNNRRITEGQSLINRVMVKESTPCIFLANGKCSIYPVRPFICRSWSSYSRKACMDAFSTGNHTAEIETSTSSNFVFFLARESIQEACRIHGLESEPLELPRAMDRCLSNTSPFDLWLNGVPVFEIVDHSFMDTQIISFFKRFSLSCTGKGPCMEYFLYSREKKQKISTALVLSYDADSKSLNVLKFHPEIYRESIPKYMSAACFFLMIHHAASVFKIPDNSFIFLETGRLIFDTFFSRLKEFHFIMAPVQHPDSCSIRGIYQDFFVETSMITGV